MEIEEEIFFFNYFEKQKEINHSFDSYINLSLQENIEPDIKNQDFVLWINFNKFKNIKKPINNINSIPEFIDKPKRKI